MQHPDRIDYESNISGNAFDAWVGHALKSRYEAVLHETLPASIIKALPVDNLGQKVRPTL